MPINRNFKLSAAETGISRAGTSAFSIAIVWIALTLTGSPIIAGFAESMVSLPLFFSFVFGAYVDSLASKRNLAILSSLIRAFSMFVLFIPLFYDVAMFRIIAIFSVSFLLGMTSDILNSIRSSWSKQFLAEEQYKRGTSMIGATTSLAQSAGYAISGILLTIGTVSTIYALIIIFLASTIPLTAIRDKVSEHKTGMESLGRSILSGLRYIKESSALKGIIVIMLFANLAFGTVGIFFAYLVDYAFKLPAIYYGILFIILTFGLIVGSIAGSRVKGKIGFYNALLILTMGALLISIGFIGTIYLDFAVVFIIGTTIGIVNVISQTGILKKVDQGMIARVYGAFSTFGLSVTFLSGGIGGLLIDYITLRWSFVFIGGILAIVAAVSVFFREYYNISI